VAAVRGNGTPTLTAPALLGVVYYAWVPTVGGFLLWYAGSARTSGVRASLATVWLPVSALALSVGLLGESVRAWQWAGLGCVLAAMVLAATATGKESG
jgi:drug/metabolite transporter (DMT)-like permease